MTSESRAAKDLKDDLGQRTPAVAARTADKYTRNELLKLVPELAIKASPISLVFMGIRANSVADHLRVLALVPRPD